MSRCRREANVYLGPEGVTAASLPLILAGITAHFGIRMVSKNLTAFLVPFSVLSGAVLGSQMDSKTWIFWDQFFVMI